MKRVLMIAFHYPPAVGSSGVQRALKFSSYLPALGWEPFVLTARTMAYPQTGDGQLAEVPPQARVLRTFALDTARHLAVCGAYPAFLAWPDRWVSWWAAAVIRGLWLIHRYRPRAIWSTYPIATAHLIGLSLQRLTGLPWIADFRDSMTEEGYPTDPKQRAIYRWLERRTVSQAASCVFTAPGTVRMYKERYPQISPDRWSCILNGYDEESFAKVGHVPSGSSLPGKRRLVLVHSGIVYPSERDPRQLFTALAELQAAGRIASDDVVVRLRASGHEPALRKMIDEAGVGALVSLEPPMEYGEALAEMLSADGLLILQASNCNHQIPAKLYEYLRAARPILALTDPTGDTADLLKRCGISTIAPLDSAKAISDMFIRFIDLIRTGQAQIPAGEDVRQFSRERHTAELAQLLDAVT